MWHSSYGELAAQRLAADHRAAAAAALVAEAPGTMAPNPVRRLAGEWLIRLGARLALPSSGPSSPSAVR